MSADRLHESLDRLRASAAALERGEAAPVPQPPPSPASKQDAGPPIRRHSTARVVAFALAYPAVSLMALTAALAVGDTALPRPDAPHLAEPTDPPAPLQSPLVLPRPTAP